MLTYTYTTDAYSRRIDDIYYAFQKSPFSIFNNSSYNFLVHNMPRKFGSGKIIYLPKSFVNCWHKPWEGQRKSLWTI